MESKRALLCLMCGLVTGAVGAQTTSNWLMQAVSVGLPQSVLVRDAIDSGKYYLCWTDGVDRFGVTFRKTSLDRAFKTLPRGGRQSVSTFMGTAKPGWTSADANVCWPS